MRGERRVGRRGGGGRVFVGEGLGVTRFVEGELLGWAGREVETRSAGEGRGRGGGVLPGRVLLLIVGRFFKRVRTEVLLEDAWEGGATPA